MEEHNFPKETELTIVSVYHNSLSKRLLELNYDLTCRLNPDITLRWLVGDNTSANFTDTIDAAKFTVVRNPRDYGGLGSHQHAGAINECLTHVQTRFVVSLDSDFYILRQEWIHEVTTYMQDHNLAFFGVTYHARDYVKYRYFPCVVCVFVDLEKVGGVGGLDFFPEIEISVLGKAVHKEKIFDKKNKTFRKKIKRFIPGSLAFFAGRVMRTLSMTSRRLAIATGRDTSYRIFAHYGHDPTYRREYVRTVFDPDTDVSLVGRLWMPLNRLIERLLPDRLCYVPKRKDSYTDTAFKDLGYADLGANGWEEYMWQGAPFGTHIRGSKTWKRNPSEDDEVSTIRKMLAMF
ncbi:MAG: glycosyltransferase [Candidatus Sungbacteria bacterium]|nr:glycosyltransferase [bacterium]MDZ4285440.1 glycosyltransferase [Candidatus Sungbacteria bacterium]